MNFLHTALAASEEQGSAFLVELWNIFYNEYLHPSVYYSNLNIDGDSIFFINMIVLGLCIGIIIASFVAVFNKRVLGEIVRKLLLAEALSPSSAKTLEELGIENSFLARYAVRKSTTLRRVVKCREEEEYIAAQIQKRQEYLQAHPEDKRGKHFADTEYQINPYADVFYIPENMKYMADIKFEKKGSTWLSACMSIPVMLVIFIAVVIALPHILSLVNDMASAANAPSNKYL